MYIAGTELKAVDRFMYLGSVISSDGSLEKEIAGRISKASESLGRLRSESQDHQAIHENQSVQGSRAQESPIAVRRGRCTGNTSDSLSASMRGH